MGDLRSLEALRIDISACASFIIPIIEEKLPEKVSSIGDSGQGVHFALEPSADSLKAYLTGEEQAQKGMHPTSQQPLSRYDTYEPQFTSTLSTAVQTRCQLYKGAHVSSHCTLLANKRAAVVLHLRLCLNCLNPGHRAANCTAEKPTAPNAKANIIPAFVAFAFSLTLQTLRLNVKRQRLYNPLSRTNANANIASRSTSNAPSAADAETIRDSSSKPTTTNCVPVFDNDLISNKSHAHIDMKSSTEVFSGTRVKNIVVSVATISSVNSQQNSPKPKADVIFLKTAKAVVVVNDKTLVANILFDEGSQCSYIRAGFAEQLGLKSQSYKRLSVSGFEGVVIKHNNCVATIGLQTPSDIASF